MMFVKAVFTRNGLILYYNPTLRLLEVHTENVILSPSAPSYYATQKSNLFLYTILSSQQAIRGKDIHNGVEMRS